MKKRQGSLIAAVVIFAMLAGMTMSALLSSNVTRRVAERRAHDATDLYTYLSCASIASQQLMHDMDSLRADCPYDPLYLNVEAYQQSCDDIYSKLFDGDGNYIISDLDAVIDYAGLKDTSLKEQLLKTAEQSTVQLKASSKLILNYNAEDNIVEFADGDRVALEEFDFTIRMKKGKLLLNQQYRISGLYIAVGHRAEGFTVQLHSDEAKCSLLDQQLND